MIKLYGKIFIGFWLATIAILASWMLSLQYVESTPEAWHEERPGHFGPPPRFMLQLIYGLENLPADELPDWLNERSREIGGSVYLLDRNGSDFLGRDVPAKVSRFARNLDGPRRRAHHRSKDAVFLAHRVRRADHGPMTAIVVLKRPQSPLVQMLMRHLWLRLLMAVVISGLICWGLSRFLTQRLKKLQMAARQLADGDLDTRIDVRASGGDETDALARDFNSMAAQLNDKIQAQKRLMRDVSHELRSPLARMRVALALAERDPEKRSTHMQRIERETERLDELIAQLLIVPDGPLELSDSLDLVALLGELTKDVAYEAEAKNINVELNCSLTEAVVASSGDLLKKAFENVLRNAVHYSPPDSVVRLALEHGDNGYEVRVEDAGPGVPEAELPRLFDDFYRVDRARQRSTGGYGLGLSIARRALAQHGGTIRAANTSSGLAVIIELPANFTQ